MTPTATGRTILRSPWLVASLVLLLLPVLAYFAGFLGEINHDCAMYVFGGNLILEGKVPYDDFIELNPPLIFYLNVVPAFVSKLSGIAPAASFMLCVWLFLFCLTGLAAVMLLRHQDADESVLFPPLIFSLSFFNFLVAEWGDYGQRHQLAAMGISLFFIVRYLRWRSLEVPAAFAIISGVTYGLMIALVPHYALITIATEAVFIARAKRIRHVLSAEVISAAAVLLAYTAHFLLLPAVARNYFFTRLLPMISVGYQSYNRGSDMLTSFPFVIGVLPLLIFSLWNARKLRSSFTTLLTAWCAAGYVVVLVQLKGWFNHYIPMFAGALMFFTTQLSFLWARQTGKVKRSDPAQVAITLLVFGIFTQPAVIIRANQNYTIEPLPTILRESSPGDTIVVISSAVWDSFPSLLVSGRKSGFRYLFTFPLHMADYIEKKGEPEAAVKRLKRERELVLDELEEDIKRSSPTLILLENDIKDSESFREVLGQIKQDYFESGVCRSRASTLTIFKRNY